MTAPNHPEPVTNADEFAPNPADPQWQAAVAAAQEIVYGGPGAGGESIVAAALIAAIDKLGARLVPPDTTTRTEWGVRLTWNDGRSQDFERAGRIDAEVMHDHHVLSRRENPGWLVTSTLIRREITHAVGSWVPVPTTPDAES